MTCVDVLSPSNKRRGSEGWESSTSASAMRFLLGSASLVEIDLLRGGQRLPMVEPWPTSAYYFLVGRQSRVPYCRVRPVHCHQVLTVRSSSRLQARPDVSLALGH